MRRGHPGIGGWRGDNPRHFRPRSGGTPHFRPPRNYGLLETPRYSPSGPRIHRGPHPHSFNTHDDRGPQDHQDRNYRGRPNNNLRLYDRGQNQHQDHNDSRQIFPLLQRMRHSDVPEHPGTYKDRPHYFEDTNTPDLCHINSLGDVDHRQSGLLHDFDQRNISPWANPPPGENNRHYYDGRNLSIDPYRHNSREANTIPIVDTGHRPPSSDHYGSTSRPAVDNNNTSFSRSIDDTVDIVRKRLMNRSDSQHLSIDQTIEPNYPHEEARESMSSSYHNVHQEQPIKKKIQRERQFVKSNCDKIKTKIVHQLFKMDKDRIHKLMDNPSSSTKFEYAISSLITESQNSLNRHMRSVAEKSLCNSSDDFIQNDNNTIYEDTFMKQMQCILEPQDTVLLEDIKPLVMAELSKVLQLDDFQHRFDTTRDQGIDPHPSNDHSNYDHYANEFSFDEITPDRIIDHSQTLLTGDEVDTNYNCNQETNYDQSIPLYERRPARQSTEYSERIDRRMSSESQCKARRSLDSKPAKIEEPIPLFDAHERFSDDDDPFAELDKQYHVAVDHNFIETDDPTNQQSIPSSCSSSPNIKSETFLNVPYEIKNEIESQIQNIARSPLKLFSAVNNNIEMEQKPSIVKSHVKQELEQGLAKENEVKATNNILNKLIESSVKQENITKPKEQVKESEISIKESKSSAVSSPRKRSIDQRPSHRKEKRKKSESSQSEASSEISNKNTNTKVNDCSSNSIEKSHESSNSVFNLFFSSDVKDHKKSESSDKLYSDKYVKRKEPHKKVKEKESKHKETESKKKHNQSSSSHSILSPKDNNHASNSSQTPTRMDKDAKKKLKPIDMFNEQLKKPNSIHQAHRNTAAVTVTKNAEENKPKKPGQVPNKTTKTSVTPQVLKKLQTKETQTCLSKSISSRFSQTDKLKLSVKSIQTDPVTFEKPKFKSNDTFERMKEIDLEIQVLLQEKFKLYSSLESKDSNKSSMETLGMAVLNVETTKDEDNDPEHALSEDTIVDDFTNIPVEELEQIAFESVDNEMNEDLVVDKRSLRTKVLQQERKKSESPNTKRLNKKSKEPNISLIEQIITDDRPLEDIISLDALENVGKQSPKVRKRPPKSRSKKKATKKNKTKPVTNTNPYGLKECVVLLLRKDMSRYMKQDPEPENIPLIEENPSHEPPICKPLSPEKPNCLDLEESAKEEQILEHEEIIEETVENDLQFDMLDVSEDIVIGDNCEIKSIVDKVNERVDVPITEEIILDNSQSSMEDMIPSESMHVDNECKMFDYSTDENLRRDSVTVVGNADAVLAIECIENDFIAACLDGNVYHFGSDGQLLNTLRGSNLAVTCLTIVKEKYETTVYTGSLDSRIRYYDLETGLEKGPECNVLSPIQTMDRAWDTVFVGTRTGFVLQFECKNNMLIPVSTVKFSEQSILALRAMKEGPRKVLLVAARSENVTIKDAQTGLLLRTLSGPKMTVYTLLFEDGKVYCGTSSHHIHVFDYSSGGHVGSHEGGKGAVCLRAQGGLLFAGCYDGCVYVYREGESRPLAQLRGPSLMLLSLAVVGTKIIAGYKDRSLYIWKIPLSIWQEMIL